jgi:hypothetical protein
MKGFFNTITTLEAPGTAIASSAARTSMTVGSTQFRKPLAADTFANTGDMIMLMAAGIITTVVTTPGTLILDFSLAGTAICSTGAMTLNIVAQTNTPWILTMYMSAKTVGSGTAATLVFHGYWLSPASILTPAGATGPGPGGQIVPYSGTATGASTTSAGFDSTIANVIDINSTFSVSTANSIQLLQAAIIPMTATGF